MTEIQQYLAEEIAEDHADGLVSRREALRRLGFLGLGGARPHPCSRRLRWTRQALTGAARSGPARPGGKSRKSR